MGLLATGGAGVDPAGLLDQHTDLAATMVLLAGGHHLVMDMETNASSTAWSAPSDGCSGCCSLQRGHR